ncbi:L-aminoadipate-semialdehyde dehydrogenase-phosphopantetheinyl transferase-like isoform X2 [Phalaenopsis equestris]|uniref:L-aminoadipate-semialdehyde dehydrogenase-phosphopantetheinyl transferase-like isoform X2 n=1 Tax=Phalaenopsis equestris TaxID=78828 RepID=UPI0009E65100|nr:L-aminoadipate-semialdehyde dehydrogenase-phosphopantetheinyl transferase-like isoform X2 [Phalaenopsis equestris]XP_020580379.1 L-aminoadipate-semialdehyde dehydrogenase-phosphopantetheinyl transferase-like isoform X2 [Phalaenopsis equestris]
MELLEEWNRFIRYEDRKRALVSRLLQYTLVHDIFGIPIDKILIKRTAEGKPYLPNADLALFPNFNFNASHHGNYVGIASEPSFLVGFDIVSDSMPIKETVIDFMNNFSSHFTTLEWTDIMKSNNPYDSLATFYRYWSLKEAFVKAIGAGLGYGLHRLEFNHNNWTNIFVCIDGEESRDWRFWHIELDQHHWASVARGHPRCASESFEKTFSALHFEPEDYWNELQIPDDGFTFWTVEELIRPAILQPCLC